METAETIPSPPPYHEASQSQPDVLDRLIDLVVRERLGNSADRSPETGTHDPDESRRVRNFVRYVLSIDYQTYIGGAALSSADRAHFNRIYTTICDLYTAHGTQTVPTPDERRRLAPYFDKYLHQPCMDLNIPTEYVMLLVSRFTKYQTASGQYKGCCFGILHNIGLGALATKLSIDSNIVIPRVVQPREREKVLKGAEEFAIQYFDSVYGIESSVTRTSTGREWESWQTIQYEANERGKAYEEQRQDAIAAARPLLSIGHWMTRVKGVMEDILCRHRKSKNSPQDAGRDPEFSSTGHGHPMPNPILSAQGYVPAGWGWAPGIYVPDYFEHRPHLGASDL